MTTETDRIQALVEALKNSPAKHKDTAAREKAQAEEKAAIFELVGIVLTNISLATDALLKIASAAEGIEQNSKQ